jgi:hypothetical protein
MGRAIVVLLAVALPPQDAIGQTVRATIDCSSQRLDGAERETCRSPDLLRLTSDVDRVTAHLEATLTGRNKEALLDTEGPFRVQRNNCENVGSGVHECIERILRRRLDAVTAAATSPATILSETTAYSFLNVPYFLKWGARLVGKRVRLWGCMTLDPGPTPASRLHGTILDCASGTRGARVAARFQTMNETRATWFYDAKKPGGYWEGVVERRDSGLVLAQIEP